jgi:hypothetical protein
VALWRAGEVGAVVLELSALRAAQLPVLQPPIFFDGSSFAALRGREFRFAVPAVRAVHLPRDQQSLANLWKSISFPPTGQSESAWSAAVWTALMAPASCIPLIPHGGCGQEFAAVAVVEMTEGAPSLAIVRVGLAVRASKYAQPAIQHASAIVETDPAAMAERLEYLFIDALPQARSVALRAGKRAVWLGGDRTVSSANPGWRERITAAFAVMGLRVEIVEEPSRHIRSVETSLGSATAPGHLVIWQSMCHNAERLIRSFEAVTADGEVICLASDTYPDVLAEARLALMQLGLAEASDGVSDKNSRGLPAAGEERFYVKVGGGKAGDVFVSVPDCGHGQWGSDLRRKAPRAVMGVERLEGMRPKVLFRCARCTKHRWRARF